MIPLVRSASLTHFAEIAEECGLEPRALLVEAGLPSGCLLEPDLKVPAAAVGRLLELAAARGREPAFGLRMAEKRRLSNLGALGLLVRDEPTLRSALESLVRHIHLQNEALVMRLEQSSNLVVIREELAGEGNQPLRQATELALGVTFRVLRVFMGSAWRPRLVCFTHRAPADREVHRRVFGEAVEFVHEFNGIVCNEADLDRPSPGADPVMARYARQLVESRGSASGKFADRVRELALLLLPRGYCRIEVVAQHMGADRRTIARRLESENTTFSELVNAVRQELLARYMEDGARPLEDVSLLLGFSAASAFSRWHRQQFGVTARKRRSERSSRLA